MFLPGSGQDVNPAPLLTRRPSRFRVACLDRQARLGICQATFALTTQTPMPLARHHDGMRIWCGFGCARVRLVLACPSLRLMPGAFPAPRHVASCTTYSSMISRPRQTRPF